MTPIKTSQPHIATDAAADLDLALTGASIEDVESGYSRHRADTPQSR